FHPGAELSSASSTSLQLLEDFLRKGSGSTSGEDLADTSIQRLIRWVTQHSHMPVTPKQQPIHREVTARGAEEQILSLAVGTSSRFLTTEASHFQITRFR